MEKWLRWLAGGSLTFVVYKKLLADILHSACTETFGRYKFLWSGCVEGTAGVGFLVEEKWVDQMLEVKRKDNGVEG